MPPGVQHLQFTSTSEFEVWKGNEEEATYASYVKGQQSYHPTSNNGNSTLELNIVIECIYTDIKWRHYFICCRDGKSRMNTQPRQTSKVRSHQKPSRKVDACCISRMYVTAFTDGHVEVKYISAHTAHELNFPIFHYLKV